LQIRYAILILWLQLLSYSHAIQHEPPRHWHLRPRQLVDPCSAQCGAVDAAATNCHDTKCLCPTILAQGPQCSSCWETVNATVATALAAIITDCKFSTTPATTITAPPTAIATPCSSQCGTIYASASSCRDGACFCPAMVSQGPQCALCWDAVNVTYASLVASAYSSCQTELREATGTITAKPTATGQCSAQCSLIASAMKTCSDDPCFCSAVSVRGAQCLSCWLDTNNTLATAVASIFSACGNGPFTTGVITFSPTSRATIPSSGADVSGGSLTSGIMYLGMMVLSILTFVLCF
jgi:hypothetical protein